VCFSRVRKIHRQQERKYRSTVGLVDFIDQKKTQTDCSVGTNLELERE
ncbi:MAG: hypothetical protein ACJA1P_001261, partial [Maribacter sp.]